MEVELHEYEYGVLGLKEVVKDERKFACSTDYAFVSAYQEAPELKIIASISTMDIHELIARKESGILIASDLRGKRIAYTPNTSGEQFLLSFLTFNYINYDEVILVDLPPSRMKDAILNGEVDAVHLWDIYAYPVKKELGSSAVIWNTQLEQDSFWLLVSHEKMIQDSPQVIEAVLRSLSLAEDFIETHPQQSYELALQRWGREQEYMEHIWPRIRFRLTLDQALIVSMEDSILFKDQNKSAHTPMPNFLQSLYLPAMQKIKPHGVTVYH